MFLSYIWIKSTNSLYITFYSSFTLHVADVAIFLILNFGVSNCHDNFCVCIVFYLLWFFFVVHLPLSDTVVVSSHYTLWYLVGYQHILHFTCLRSILQSHLWFMLFISIIIVLLFLPFIFCLSTLHVILKLFTSVSNFLLCFVLSLWVSVKEPSSYTSLFFSFCLLCPTFQLPSCYPHIIYLCL